MCSPAFTDEIRFAHPDHTVAGFDDAAKSLIWKRKQISGNVDGIHTYKEDYYSHMLSTAVDSPCHAVPGKSCVLLRITSVTLERIIQSINLMTNKIIIFRLMQSQCGWRGRRASAAPSLLLAKLPKYIPLVNLPSPSLHPPAAQTERLFCWMFV